MLKRLVPVALFILTACGGSTTSSDSTDPSVVAIPTTIPAPPTTVAEIFNPASGEQAVTCDSKAVGASYGEKVKLEFCTETWAMGDTDQDT